MKQSNKTWLWLCLGVIVLAIGFGSWQTYEGRLMKVAVNEKHVQISQKNKKTKLTRIIMKRPIYSAAEEVTDQFMSTFLTYDDQVSYDARRKHVKSLVSEDVYQDRKLFKTDKYQKVTQLQLQSTYDKMFFIPTKLDETTQTIAGKVYASYSVNFEGENAKTVTKVFTITYDARQDKLVQVDTNGMFNLSADSSLY